MYQPIDHPWNDDFDFVGFRQQVEAFAQLLRTANLRNPHAFKWELITHLARLYASGTQMPPYSPFTPEESDDGQRASSDTVDPRRADFRARHIRSITDIVRGCTGDDDAYYTVSWPNEDTVEQTTLSGELLWIYSDLLKGAVEWDAGRFDDAAFTWILGFEEGYWGSSCLSALNWLHVCAGDRIGLIGSPTSEDQESVPDQ